MALYISKTSAVACAESRVQLCLVALMAALVVSGCKPSRIRTTFHSTPSENPAIVDLNSEGGAAKATGNSFVSAPVTVGGNFQKNVATGNHFMVRGGALNGR